MSKPKRASFVDLLEEDNVVTSSRDDVVTLPAGETGSAKQPRVKTAWPSAEDAPASSTHSASSKKRSKNDNQRHSYHTSLYLPAEAQFALREIALTMRRAKPHDVMLEALAEMFEKYNKGDLARECRSRISSRDKIVT